MAISLNTNTRVSGLFSGLDTDQLVKDMMKIQQSKYNKIYQNKVKAEWKRDAYTDVNNTLRKFRDEFASFLSTKNNMLASTTYKSFSVTASKEGTATLSATSAAQSGAYTLEVEQLASGTKISGGKVTTTATGLSASVVNNTAIEKLSSLAGGTIGSTFSFSVNGKEFTFQSTDTLRHVMDTVNNSDAGVTMSYSQLTDSFTMESNVKGAYDPGLPEPVAPAVVASDDPGYAQYKLDKAQYDKDKLAYDNNAKRNLVINDRSGALAGLGIDGSQKTAGQNAKVIINGVSVERESNSFEIDGINYNLTKAGDGPVTFSVNRDLQKSVDSVKDFVKSLNTMLEDLYGKITEKKHYDYAPLTDEQRSELKENEIALWEVKAKSGLLRRDSATDSFINSIRSAVSDAIGGIGSLSDIGISTGSYRPNSPVEITLDENKLMKALEGDPDKVMRLFTENVKDASGVVRAQSGLMYRITDAIDAYSKSTKDVSIVELNDSISGFESRMKTEQTRLDSLQARLYKQFSALEMAMAKLNSQSSALSAFSS